MVGYHSEENKIPDDCPLKACGRGTRRYVRRQWIPVSEKLPKYSNSVLVSLFDHEIDIGSYYCDTWHISGCGSVEDGAVLAWMQLSEPSEGDKE
jgi:hypothetical protein